MGCCKSGEECCERCEDVCPCIAGYPQLWALFILFIVGGVGTLVASLYSFISLKTSIFRFAWRQPFLAYVNASALGLGIGAMMLVLAVLTWCACQSDGASAAFKAFFAIMLVLCAAGNIAVAVGTYQVYRGMDNQRSAVYKDLERSWTVLAKTDNSTVLCKVQKQLECQGFESGDCTGTRSGILERCAQSCPTPTTGGALYGCRSTIALFYRKWNLPLFAFSIISALACVTAFVIVVAKVSFNIDKQKGEM